MLGGGIDTGWIATPASDFSEIGLTHNLGIPNVSYEQWLEGPTPMTLRLNGNLDALKANDDALPWEASTDNYFNFDGTTFDGFTATTTTDGVTSTDTQSYGVIQRTPITNLTITGSTLSWPSVSNTTYQIESNTNLLTDTWNSYTSITATGTNISLNLDTSSEDKMFYRGKVE